MKLLKLTSLVGLCLIIGSLNSPVFSQTTDEYLPSTDQRTDAPETSTAAEVTDEPVRTTEHEVTEEPQPETTAAQETTTTVRTGPTTTTTERPAHLCPIDDPMLPPEGCPPEEDTPTYLPYPYDCRKFFICASGTPICQRCPNGTVWDQEHTICDREANVGCVIFTTTPPSPQQKQGNGVIDFFKKFNFF